MQLSRGFTPNIQSYVLASEGGYVNHPRDPGKATNMGITIATLRAWRGRPVTNADVRDLSQEEALQIYKAQYWDTVRADQLPLGLDYLTFDYGVNSGPGRCDWDGGMRTPTAAKTTVCSSNTPVTGETRHGR